MTRFFLSSTARVTLHNSAGQRGATVSYSPTNLTSQSKEYI